MLILLVASCFLSGWMLRDIYTELQDKRAQRVVWRNADAIMKREQERFRAEMSRASYEGIYAGLDDQQITAAYYRMVYPGKKSKPKLRVIRGEKS